MDESIYSALKRTLGQCIKNDENLPRMMKIYQEWYKCIKIMATYQEWFQVYLQLRVNEASNDQVNGSPNVRFQTLTNTFSPFRYPSNQCWWYGIHCWWSYRWLILNWQSETGRNRSKTSQNVNGHQPESGQKRESDGRAGDERHLMNERDGKFWKLFPWQRIQNDTKALLHSFTPLLLPLVPSYTPSLPPTPTTNLPFQSRGRDGQIDREREWKEGKKKEKKE